MGKAINCLKVSIYCPGLGSIETNPGKIDNKIKGNENPIPSARKIRNDENPGCNIANPRAEPIKGAVHGVATITARKPVANELT